MLEDCEISVVVLAGGGSRRMGQDKASLLMDADNGRQASMIDRVLDAAALLSRDILVVGRESEFASEVVRYVPDEYPGMGPLGGLLTGLRAMRHDRCLLVACDMPFVNVALAKQMTAMDVTKDVLAINSGSRLEPFHALYHRRCQVVAESSFVGGNRSLGQFLITLDRAEVPNAVVEALDPERWCLFNANTPDDLTLARRHAADMRSMYQHGQIDG